MRDMGFSERWFSMMMSCVTSISYLVLINGKKYDSNNPNRGVRQGSPSPYLFLVIIEGLSSFLLRVENQGLLKGIKASCLSLSVNHLLFADDCLIFCEASMVDVDSVLMVLNQYEVASG